MPEIRAWTSVPSHIYKHGFQVVLLMFDTAGVDMPQKNKKDAPTFAHHKASHKSDLNDLD